MESDSVGTHWVHEDVSLVKVAPELFKSTPNRHKQQVSINVRTIIEVSEEV